MSPEEQLKEEAKNCDESCHKNGMCPHGLLYHMVNNSVYSVKTGPWNKEKCIDGFSHKSTPEDPKKCGVCGYSKESNYERDHSHTHCWDQKSPACGQELSKHGQCCLCDTPYPQNRSDSVTLPDSKSTESWEEEFDKMMPESKAWDGSICHIDYEEGTKTYTTRREKTKVFIFKLLLKQKEELIELFSKKVTNDNGEPLCPKCGKDMERDCQESGDHLWFCSCSPGLRLSVG